MARNSLGRFYLPSDVRNEIVNLFNARWGYSDIARNTKVTKRAVHKIVHLYSLHGATEPFFCGRKDPVLITDDILEVIEIWKLQKPSIYASEIRKRLLRDNM